MNDVPGWEKETPSIDKPEIEEGPKLDPSHPRLKLPIVVLPCGNVTYDECATKLFTEMAKTEMFFLRGLRLVQVSKNESQYFLEILTASQARSAFERHVRLFAWRASSRGPVLKPASCSVDTAQGLLDTIITRAAFPEINALANFPLLYEKDGEIAVTQPGYNPHTKVFVTEGMPPPEVDPDTAVKALTDLLTEFDFVTEGDRARAIASFIAPALKLGGFIEGRVPADVAEADQSQSGKTYRQQLVAEIYKADVAIVADKDGGVGSVDESLSIALANGSLFIQFDNFRGRLNSRYLESLLTAIRKFPCRVPHKGEIIINPEGHFIFLSSNGVNTTRDFANRSCLISIRRKPDGFSFRKFPEGDLRAHVRKNQSFYLGCVLAIVKKWHAAGKPKTAETRHDFREWARTLDWIVQNIFKTKPLLDGHREAQACVSNPDKVFLRAVTLAVAQVKELGKPITATDIFSYCESVPISIPGLLERTNDIDRAARVIGSCMRRLFRDALTIEIDGFTITRLETPRQEAQGIYSTKSYIFQHTHQVAPVISAPDQNLPPLTLGSSLI